MLYCPVRSVGKEVRRSGSVIINVLTLQYSVLSHTAVHGGNISRAAAALEISPSTIYRKRQAWEGRSRAAL